MRILVTGATGFVGRNLIKAMVSEHEIHILVRPTTDFGFLGIKHAFVFKDNISDLGAYMKVHRIDGVIHLASLYIAEHKPEQIKDLVLSNVYLGTALLEACKMANIKWFLNTGSIWQNYNVQTHSDDYCPVNLYAATKQSFMTMAKYYTETCNISFCTLKLCDTYGPGDTRRKIFALFEEIARTGKLLDMSLGEQCIDIIHIDDVVDGFIHLATMLHNGETVRSEYVLSSGHHIPLRHLAEDYAERHNCHLNINWGGRPYRQREVMIPYIGHVLKGWTPYKTNNQLYVNKNQDYNSFFLYKDKNEKESDNL